MQYATQQPKLPASLIHTSIFLPAKGDLFIENMNYESIDEFGYDVVLGFKQKTAYEIVDCDWSSDVCLPIYPE